MDRELPSEKQFVIEVRATDKGTPTREGNYSESFAKSILVSKSSGGPYFDIHGTTFISHNLLYYIFLNALLRIIKMFQSR